MSEFKGTKGEWYVFDDGRFPEIKLKDQFVGQICMLPYTDAEFKKAVNSKEENLANAKLIAAAPELLEACLRVVEDFEGDYMVGGEIVDNPHHTLISNYKQAKKAIQKALK